MKSAVAITALPGAGHEPNKEHTMKLDRRTALAGAAAAFAFPLAATVPARADARRQSLVDACLVSARKVLTGKDFPDAARNMTNARGVLIMRVEPLSTAFDAGVERGTVLLEVNRHPVDTAESFRRLAREARPGDVLTLFVYSPELEQRQLKTVRVEER